MSVTAVELFSGAGGILLALKTEGVQVLLDNEINSQFCQTLRANFPDMHLFEGDIKTLTAQRLMDYIGNSQVDLVAGGPPCQGFSIFGKRRFVNTRGYNPEDDSRNKLVYEYIRIVSELKPLFFIMENVKGFMTLDRGLFVEEVKNKFNELGYHDIWCQIVCATDYGVPQERQRMFMIGNRIGVHFEPPPPTHYPLESGKNPTYLTVGDAIMDLAGREGTLPNHIALKHKPIVEARYAYIEEGEKLDLSRLPPELVVATRKDSKTGKVANYSHVYRRLDRKKPATTMVPGHNAFPVHPTLNRTLTPREAARLQTFPDSHIFLGTRQEQCIQVGNAVPPKMIQPFIHRICEYIEYYKKGGVGYEP